MELVILLALLAPLFGFLVLLTTCAIVPRAIASLIGCLTLVFSFCCIVASVLALPAEGGGITYTYFSWIPVRGIDADFALHVDHISQLMGLIITGVGSLIHIYSIGYTDHERDYARFFACMNFFVFAMLLLVLAANLTLVFVGWEGVGLASYLLIGFWYERESAAAAAVKAFVVNRVGDLGFILALLLTFILFGTSDIQTINQQVNEGILAGSEMLTFLTLLFFVGAIGKSAQIPLHVWLPDAMEGPTPVSALIHAATMVTAGVYLLVRLHPIFLAAPTTLEIVGSVGGATALFAALCAMQQPDLKRVLAYSTVSQLGYMFLACGVGAFYAAMFHLTTHAFMKALLFLSAGNIIHMMHGKTLMKDMGGLAKPFPKTNIMFLIGVLAMSGIPPLAAFFSKDLILEMEYASGFMVLYTVGLLTSLLTAFYLTRAYFLTFQGDLLPQNKDLKEAPAVMWIPVSVLAIFSAAGGYLGFATGRRPILESFLEDVRISPTEDRLASHFDLNLELFVAIFCAVAGVFCAAIMYTRYKDTLGKSLSFLAQSFYIDQIYDVIFVRSTRSMAALLARFVEPHVIQGAASATVKAVDLSSLFLQKGQNGKVRSYLAWMTLGASFIIIYLARGGNAW